MDNSEKALAFLKEVSPEGPWCLTAILPDKKVLNTSTFYSTTETDCLAWLRAFNGSHNLYWHVNPVMQEMKKKAEREDIRDVVMFHVDVDPGVGQDLAAERSKILDMFTSRLPQGVPEPSILISSGGGYQAFWLLEQPLPINGDLARAEDAKLYNRQLEILFGADNCHNIDRLMRLPFTMNIPDAKKIQKGRKAVLADVIWCKPDRRYPLNKFMQAPALQASKDITATPGLVNISGNVRRIAELDELNEWNVPDRLKVIMVQGCHPDAEEQAKKKDNSRSSWLFDLCCNLVRCGVPDEVIYGIITDPEWKISESVLELKGNAEKYAIKQITSAKEFSIDPWLQKLNNKHAVVRNVGGRCLVVEEVEDESLCGRMHLTMQSLDHFQNGYENQMVQTGTNPQGLPIMKEVGKWWRKHPQRRQYERLVFAPNRDLPGAYNLWKGYAYEALPGNAHQMYLDHIKHNICDGNEEYYTYLLGWMARMIQFPAEPGQVAVVLQGGRGTGKGQFVQHLGMLLGRHYLQVSNPSHIVGNFNSHLRDSVLLFSDEAFYANDKKHTSVLKTLITEESLPIERKGIDVEICPNYVHLIMASNEEHVVRTGIDERRFFILQVGKHQRQNSEYFREIAQRMSEEKGYQHLLYFLLNYDLSKFNVRNMPKTDALREQTAMSLSYEDEWWYRSLQLGELMGESWPYQVPCDDVFAAFVKDVQEHTRSAYLPTKTGFGIWLQKRVPGLERKQATVEREVLDGNGFLHLKKTRAWCYLMPPLNKCREAWDEHCGKPEPWPDLGV